MISSFKQFLLETNIVSNNGIESFFKDINTIGYSNPLIANEFMILDNIGLEFKLRDNIVYIMSLKTYDIRKERTTMAFQNVVEIAEKNNIVLGISPFPFEESNMNMTELNNMYMSFGFKHVKGKWIKYPN